MNVIKVATKEAVTYRFDQKKNETNEMCNTNKKKENFAVFYELKEL